MSGFSAIDLSRLPAPEVVEPLDYESILAAMKAELIRRDARLEATLALESEPLTKLLEVCAYRELLLRQRVNDAAKGVMLAHAGGADLDNLAVLFGVARQVVDAGDPHARPPVPPTYEDDTRLRQRTQLSLEGHTTAGPVGSYVFWGLSADPQVKDIAVYSTAPGQVAVRVLSTQGTGRPSPALLAKVRSALNHEDVRPLTDRVRVRGASIIRYQIDARLTLDSGPDAHLVEAAARQAAATYVAQHHRLGRDIRLSGLYAALHQPGVQNVTLVRPTADIRCAADQAAHCDSIGIRVV